MSDEHLANVLGAVALRVATDIDVAAREASGLTSVQLTALTALANYAQGGSTEDLRHTVDLSHSATVRLVDRLVEDGLVRRRADADDRRVSAIHLTARGRRVVERVRAARMRVLCDFVAGLPKRDRASLGQVLDTVMADGIAPAPEGVELSQYVCRLCDWKACGHPDRCPVTQAVSFGG